MARSYKRKASIIARQRMSAHKGSTNRRLFSDHSKEHIIGAAGELAFADLCGIDIDRTIRPEGDGGVDFFVPYWIAIDVKTSTNPYNLQVKKKEINRKVDIYVLAGYNESTGEVNFIGWMRRAEVRTYPTQAGKFGENYIVPASDLHDMRSLLIRIKREEK